MHTFSALAALLVLLLLSGCDAALLDPKGQVGQEELRLILTAFGLMMIVVIPVIVMTVVFGWRYRHTNMAAKYTPDWEHSNKIEAVVWLIPCVIILLLGILTWKTSHSLSPDKAIDADAEPLEIQAVALDWKWLFIYPEQQIATVNEVAFPTDTPVHFRVTSGSVMNAFFIPRLGSQIYAMAGMDNSVNLIADEEGTYGGRSTNYSGAGFSEMLFEAHATSQEGFDAWLEQVRQSPQTLNYPEGYQQLAEPTEAHPVEYFATVSPELYSNIIQSFHAGEERHGHNDEDHASQSQGEHRDMAMSAEAAE